MIRIIDFRLIIEKYDTHEKYYPKVVGFDTTDDCPLSKPEATIKIISANNSSNPESVSHVEFDDIARLQVSIRYYPQEKHVWVDIFEGRILNQSKELGKNNNIELSCVGHIAEAFYALLKTAHTYTNADARTIISDLATDSLSRLTYSATYAESGLVVSAYNVETEQIYMSDALEEMEKLSGYKRYVDVLPTYTATGNLSTCYLVWKQFPTTPTKKYKVIEGSPRLISASFDVVGDEVYTVRYVRGGQDANGVQYSGNYSDSAAVAKHGNRYIIDTQTWVKSNTLCTSIATGLVSDSKNPYVSGQVVLEGTPDAKKGDLVTVELDSLEVNGASISGNYVVQRVTHSYSEKGYRTSLDLDKIKKDSYDYLSKNITSVVKKCYKNQSKK